MDPVKKTCETCSNFNHSQSLDDLPHICWTCSSVHSGGIEERPYWRPIMGSIVSDINDRIRERDEAQYMARQSKEASDGSSADYYKLPPGATQLQDLISYKNMNAQIGEIFRACYRLGQVSHSPDVRDVKKILFYANAELARLERKNGF